MSSTEGRFDLNGPEHGSRSLLLDDSALGNGEFSAALARLTSMKIKTKKVFKPRSVFIDRGISMLRIIN